jgi:hypothetical protein
MTSETKATVEYLKSHTQHRCTVKVIKPRRTRWDGHIARRGEMRNTYKILVGKSEEKRQRGKTQS